MTRVELYNRVLTALGYRRIDDADYASEEVTRLNELYPQALTEVLQLRPWSCAMRYADMLEIEEEFPDHPWPYSYQLPAEPKCLQVVSVSESSDGFESPLVRSRHTVMGEVLYSRVPIETIKYKAEIDIEDMDPHLANLVAARLLMRSAVPLKGSPELEMRKEQDFESLYITAGYEESKIAGFDRAGMRPHSAYNRRPIDESQRFMSDGRRV